MTGLVRREDRGAIATLTLNRPEKLNALTVALFDQLHDHVADIEAHTDAIAVVVLRGAGKCFSAGHDLTDIAAGEKASRPNLQAMTIERLANLPLPVITVVHGHCYTGALELALAGDLIVAAQSAKFADTHAKWALAPTWGMTQRLPRRIGRAKAAEMMFTARTFSGLEALEMGLANICVPDDDLEAVLEDLIATIAANSSFTHRINKRLLIETDGVPLASGIAHEIYRNAGQVGPDSPARIAQFSAKTVQAG